MAVGTITTPAGYGIKDIPAGVLTPQEESNIETYKAFFGPRAEGYVQEYLGAIGAYERTPPPGSVETPIVGEPNVVPIQNPDGSTSNVITSATTTPTALSQFDTLLSNLASGGTPDIKERATARTEEIARTRGQQGQYTKEAAVSDAQGLMTKAINDALRIAAPKITAYAEGAGTSKSSLAALQTQEAALRGAEAGAAQAGQMTTAYGQVYNQLAGVLEGLTRQDPNSPSALLANAIIGSKGLLNTAIVNVPAPQQQGTAQQQGTTNAARTTPAASPTPVAPKATGSENLLDLYGLNDIGRFYPTPQVSPQAGGTRSNIVIGQGTPEVANEYDTGSSAAFEEQGYEGVTPDNTIGESAYDAMFTEDY